jgi:hypothetical protein
MEKRKVSVKIRLSKNSRCVIVMTNLAFAPVGRKRVGTVNRFFDIRFGNIDCV